MELVDLPLKSRRICKTLQSGNIIQIFYYMDFYYKPCISHETAQLEKAVLLTKTNECYEFRSFTASKNTSVCVLYVRIGLCILAVP